MRKIRILLTYFWSLILVAIIGFSFFGTINNSNKQLINLQVNFNNLEQNQEAPTNIGTLETTNIDWNNFNKTSQILPTWTGNAVQGSLYNSEIYSFTLVIYDQSSTGLPNGNILDINSFWSDVYFYSTFAFDTGVIVVEANDWESQNNFDWNKRNQNLVMGLVIANLDDYTIFLSKLNQNDPNINIDLSQADGVDNTYDYEYLAPNVRGIDINKNSSEFIININFALNDGPSDFIIKANDITIYNQPLLDGLNEVIYDAPTFNQVYLFDFYLNGELLPTYSESLLSPFTNASVQSLSSYQVKPNYQPPSGSIASNGIVGASITLSNPSNIVIESVNFILKDLTNNQLISQLGTISASDINTYNIAFDQYLLNEGIYNIDYIVTFNNDANLGPYQSAISGSFDQAIITTERPSEPKVSFNLLEVINHPTSTNWNNGHVKVHYSMNMIEPTNTFASAHYRVIDSENQNIVIEGNLPYTEVGGILDLNNLVRGNYYLEWDLTYVHDDDIFDPLIGQTSTVLLEDLALKTPTIFNTDLVATEWYSSSKSGNINGYIQLSNFEDAIGKTLQITPFLNNVAENAKEFIIPENGVIVVENMALNSYGEYQLKFAILNYKINSQQNNSDLLLNDTYDTTIIKHVFLAPDISASATYSANQDRIFVTFHALDGTPENPWLDIESFQASIEIDFNDNIRQIISFDETWANANWNALFPQVTFEFPLSNDSGITNININAQFANSHMNDQKNIDVTRAVDSPFAINYVNDRIASPAATIIGIVMIAFLGFSLIVILPTSLSLIDDQKTKEKNKQNRIQSRKEAIEIRNEKALARKNKIEAQNLIKEKRKIIWANEKAFHKKIISEGKKGNKEFKNKVAKEKKANIKAEKKLWKQDVINLKAEKKAKRIAKKAEHKAKKG